MSEGGIKKSNVKYQSDVIVDLIKDFGFKHIALNPGASYRGLHDSLVNYGENDPPMMLCTHEKIAVARLLTGFIPRTFRDKFCATSSNGMLSPTRLTMCRMPLHAPIPL